jgi:hypothetical protein
MVYETFRIVGLDVEVTLAQAHAGVAGLEGLNGAIEVQLECKRCLGMARLAAVSHSRDRHSFNCKCLIPSSYLHPLLVFLVVSEAIEVSASVHSRDARTCRTPAVVHRSFWPIRRLAHFHLT